MKDELIYRLYLWVIWPLKYLFDWAYWKTHSWNRVVKIKSYPRPYEYKDSSTILLHSSFAVLVDFVERDCATMYSSPFFGYEHRASLGMKIRRGIPFSLGKILLPTYRNMTEGLKYLDEEIANGKLVFSEVKRLYLWWAIARLDRPDELTWSIEQENDFYKEDREYFNRLCNIRENLWT